MEKKVITNAMTNAFVKEYLDIMTETTGLLVCINVSKMISLIPSSLSRPFSMAGEPISFSCIVYYRYVFGLFTYPTPKSSPI
jgi:hypothetical protein